MGGVPISNCLRRAALAAGIGLFLHLQGPGMLFAMDAPRRVVSLNLCTDQLGIALAGPNRFASVSFLAADPVVSNVAELAAGLPRNRGFAEDVLAQRPDLVLAGLETTHATVALLRRLGIAVEVFPMAESVIETRAQIERLAALLGAEERGRNLIAALDRDLALARAQMKPTSGKTVLAYGGRGFTSGRGTLINDLMSEIGLTNQAAMLGLRGYGMLSLEAVVAAPPDLLVLNKDYDGTPSLAGAFLDHPALEKRIRNVAHVEMPSRLWTCAGPWLGQAALALADALIEELNQ